MGRGWFLRNRTSEGEEVDRNCHVQCSRRVLNRVSLQYFVVVEKSILDACGVSKQRTRTSKNFLSLTRA
jgi:hypothetical protein